MSFLRKSWMVVCLCVSGGFIVLTGSQADAHHTSPSTPLSGSAVQHLYADILFALEKNDAQTAWSLAISHLDIDRYPEELLELTARLAMQTNHPHMANILTAKLKERYPENTAAHVAELDTLYHQGKCNELNDKIKSRKQAMRFVQNTTIAFYQKQCAHRKWTHRHQLSVITYKAPVATSDSDRHLHEVPIETGSLMSQLCDVFVGVCPSSGQLSIHAPAPRQQHLATQHRVSGIRMIGSKTYLGTRLDNRLISIARRAFYRIELEPQITLTQRVSSLVIFEASGWFRLSKILVDGHKTSQPDWLGGSATLKRHFSSTHPLIQTGTTFRHEYRPSPSASEHISTALAWVDMKIIENISTRIETSETQLTRSASSSLGDARLSSYGLYGQVHLPATAKDRVFLSPKTIIVSYHDQMMASPTILPWMVHPYSQRKQMISLLVNFTHSNLSLNPNLGIRIVDTEANTTLLEENYTEITAGFSLNF